MMMWFNFLNIANRYIKLKLGGKKDCSLTLPVLFEVYDKFLSFSNHRFPFLTWLYTFFNFSDVPKHAKTQKIDRVSTKCDKVNQTVKYFFKTDVGKKNLKCHYNFIFWLFCNSHSCHWVQNAKWMNFFTEAFYIFKFTLYVIEKPVKPHSCCFVMSQY